MSYRLVPIRNIAGVTVTTHGTENVWGCDDGSGLVVCGEPVRCVPAFTVLREIADARKAREGLKERWQRNEEL